MAQVSALSAGGRWDVIAVEMLILPLCTRFCPSFTVSGCFGSGSRGRRGLYRWQLWGQTPVPAVPTGAGAWEGVGTSCAQPRDKSRDAKLLCWVGTGREPSQGGGFDGGRSCSEFMAAGNQLRPPQRSINPRASPQGNRSESSVLRGTARR